MKLKIFKVLKEEKENGEPRILQPAKLFFKNKTDFLRHTELRLSYCLIQKISETKKDLVILNKSGNTSYMKHVHH